MLTCCASRFYPRPAAPEASAKRARRLQSTPLKNAMIPTITVIGISLATPHLRSVIVEQVFNIPGLGRRSSRPCSPTIRHPGRGVCIAHLHAGEPRRGPVVRRFDHKIRTRWSLALLRPAEPPGAAPSGCRAWCRRRATLVGRAAGFTTLPRGWPPSSPADPLRWRSRPADGARARLVATDDVGSADGGVRVTAPPLVSVGRPWVAGSRSGGSWLVCVPRCRLTGPARQPLMPRRWTWLGWLSRHHPRQSR